MTPSSHRPRRQGPGSRPTRGSTRRDFLQGSLQTLVSATLWTAGLRRLLATELAGAAEPLAQEAIAGGTLLGTVPFAGVREDDLDTLLGSGLDGRRFQDLSSLDAESLITPNDSFFVRTRAPDGLDAEAPWRIAVRGRVRGPSELTIDELARRREPMGTHLLECSGNPASWGFGLIGAARWHGARVVQLLETYGARPLAPRVEVVGFDRHSRPGTGSLPGASWIFTLEELDAAGAFLATHMNDVPLAMDHGAPVRLVVPGWYGCTCIKWVTDLVFVGDDAPATTQMMEFATRTHQDGIPRLARDYRPATIDLAATAVRVEKWSVQGRIVYRVVGILWGGDRTTDRLVIRFFPESEYVPVERYDHRTTATWTLWTHTWEPRATGRYRIALRVKDPGTRTRRLDTGYYDRTVFVEG